LLAWPSAALAPGRRRLLRREAVLGVLFLGPCVTPTLPAFGGVDCEEAALAGRRKIAVAVTLATEKGDPQSLRPTAKALLKGPLGRCLEEAGPGDGALARHARNAREYIATVVEFDAYDKLWKDHQSKASTRYTKEKVDYSVRAYGAADRELGDYLELLRTDDSEPAMARF